MFWQYIICLKTKQVGRRAGNRVGVFYALFEFLTDYSSQAY